MSASGMWTPQTATMAHETHKIQKKPRQAVSFVSGVYKPNSVLGIPPMDRHLSGIIVTDDLKRHSQHHFWFFAESLQKPKVVLGTALHTGKGLAVSSLRFRQRISVFMEGLTRFRVPMTFRSAASLFAPRAYARRVLPVTLLPTPLLPFGRDHRPKAVLG